MSENQSFLQELEGRSQKLTFPRRQLLQKIASATLLFFVPRPGPVAQIPQKYPAPGFAIGDRVASHWPVGSYDDDDVDGVPEPEIGEITGICWHPASLQWRYQVNWTSGSSAAWMYPCFDGYLTDDSGLERLP